VTARRLLQLVGAIAIVASVAWAASRGLERLVGPRQAASVSESPPAAAPTAHITATLFYGATDGQALVAVPREVPLAEGVVAQGREIVAAELLAAPAPYVSAIPPGTVLRAFYVTEQGDAFVDLSGQVSRAHPGGSFTEMLTVYAIVNAVTANLPAVQRVQILVDGKEVDTIAGHIDVRRPLTRDLSLVRESAAATPAAAASR
jgi:spore germination protein GerM